MEKILIVEDDNDIRELIKFVLVDLEYEVEAFPTAEAFKKRTVSHQPDLFLLDIRLPDGNGVDLCAELKDQEDTSTIPIILMSAHTDSEVLDNCADDFISKPFDINTLTERIQRQLK